MSCQFDLACPICGGNVGRETDLVQCEECRTKFPYHGGLWRFLPPKRVEYYAKFLKSYHSLRRAEGWGAHDAEHYRQLPRAARDDPLASIWQIRQKNFRRLLTIVPESPIKILDVGAGNGWLANQLAQRGHLVAALDLSDDPVDGLGAWKNFQTEFECYQAEFDHLPFGPAQFDLVIFNASLHYSSSLAATLAETKRVMTPGGKILILDSPFYDDVNSGLALAREQQTRLGLDVDLGMAAFLTIERLSEAAKAIGFQVTVAEADAAWHKRLRRKLIQRKIKREPAHFPIIILKAYETENHSLSSQK